MVDDTTIQDAITENAIGPKKASDNNGSMEQHPLAEQIEADRYIRSRRAASTGLGVRFVKLIPPGQD